MNLKAKINGKEYDIVQGCTFAEEYNETLDSGSIIISHVGKIEDLLPYDDVFIYTGEFNGYPFDDNEHIEPVFYKHLLVDQFVEEILNLEEGIYKYKIELMSETKKLEVIALPNISITQPLNISKKVSVYEYICRFVDMYSPVTKVKDDLETENVFKFVKKYSVDPSLEAIFGDVYAPDFTLNTPSLKDLLNKLFLTKDRIPYVKNDVIYALDITARRGEFNNDKKYVNKITGTRTSATHCDNLRRGYSDALAQDNSCHFIEYMGFRNKDNALMTISNMRLELRNKIYKINKVYMCYYKKGTLFHINNNISESKMFLCKQDITKLVKLNTERNLLSKDWDKFNDIKSYAMTIDDLAKYKLATIGYDIGNNYISGWGEMYTYPQSFWDVKVTYVENIFNIMNNNYPLGIYSYDYLANLLDLKENDFFVAQNNINILQNKSLFFKSLFFIIDYNGFYDGATVHSKNNDRDDITINDNTSSSLSLLEQDGLYQKEKLDRFGNKTLQINARYPDTSYIQELGSVYNENNENDVIIYHREYSIFDNCVNCQYYGSKDYVLKNYFTSVYARYRTWNLMSYGESVNRAENNKTIILLSKNNCVYESNNNNLKYSNDFNIQKELLSCFENTEEPEAIDLFNYPQKINYAYLDLPTLIYDNDGNVIGKTRGKFVTDVNAFVSGYSLCFNLKMFDNISAGTYITKIEPFSDIDDYVNKSIEDLINKGIAGKDDYTGSIQTNYMAVDDEETGFVRKVGFYIGHVNQDEEFKDNQIIDYNKNTIENIYNDKLFKMPLLPAVTDSTITNLMYIEKDYYKDNKEYIDETIQFEPISIDNDCLFSQWLLKLSDLLSVKNKFSSNLYKHSSISNIWDFYTIPVYHNTSPSFINQFDGKILFKIKEPFLKILYEGEFIRKQILYKIVLNTPERHVYSRNIILNTITNLKIEEYSENTTFSIDYILEYETALLHKKKIKSGLLNFIYYEQENDYLVFRCENTFDALSDTRPEIIDLTDTHNYITNYLPKTKLYLKNMFVTTSENLLKKELVYNEYPFKQWDYNTNYYKNDIIWFKPILSQSFGFYKILNDTKTSNYEYEFLYELVGAGEKGDFISETDATRSYNFSITWDFEDHVLTIGTDLYVINDNNKKEYAKVVGIITENTDIILEVPKGGYIDTRTITPYTLYKPIYERMEDSKIADMTVTNLSVPETFKVQNDSEVNEITPEYIYVDLTNIPQNAQSVQYWFAENDSLKFVFGVNITDQDRQNGYIKIYISLLSTKDTRVFDKHHNVIGEIYNYAEQGADKPYGVKQYYKEKS